MITKLILAGLFSAGLAAMLITETNAQSLSISGTGIVVTKPQCANGRNDDGVQGTDLADPDCKNSLDNSEKASTTTSSFTTLSVSTSSSPSTGSSDLGLGDARDIDCSAFGKGGGNPDKYEAIVRCVLTPLEISARCINNGNQAILSSVKSAFVTGGPIGGEIQLDSGDVTGRGLWAANVIIPGSEILAEFNDSGICQSATWTILPSTLLIIKTRVSIQTFADGVLKDEVDRGTCTLNTDLETYTCQL